MKPNSLLTLILAFAIFASSKTFPISDRANAAEKSVAKKTSKTFSLNGWGKAVDPDGDCKFLVSKETLLINVPGSPNPHDLASEIGVTNAPRVTQTVNGDFSVEVEVDGRFQPGMESTLPGRVGYNGAGLVIMSDSQNVICLARAVMNHSDEKAKAYANFEMRANGDLERIGDANVHPLPNDGPVFLRLSRQRQTVFGAVSTDGKSWTQLTPKELPMDWPKKPQVGVVAISTSTDEFNPRFSKFKVVK